VVVALRRHGTRESQKCATRVRRGHTRPLKDHRSVWHAHVTQAPRLEARPAHVTLGIPERILYHPAVRVGGRAVVQIHWRGVFSSPRARALG
jgi:hypothetical protein